MVEIEKKLLDEMIDVIAFYGEPTNYHGVAPRLDGKVPGEVARQMLYKIIKYDEGRA